MKLHLNLKSKGLILNVVKPPSKSESVRHQSEGMYVRSELVISLKIC